MLVIINFIIWQQLVTSWMRAALLWAFLLWALLHKKMDSWSGHFTFLLWFPILLKKRIGQALWLWQGGLDRKGKLTHSGHQRVLVLVEMEPLFKEREGMNLFFSALWGTKIRKHVPTCSMKSCSATERVKRSGGRQTWFQMWHRQVN